MPAPRLETPWIRVFALLALCLGAGAGIGHLLNSQHQRRRPTPSASPTRPVRIPRPAPHAGEVRQLSYLEACPAEPRLLPVGFLPGWSQDERIALPPSGPVRPGDAGQRQPGALYVLPEGILSDIANFVRYVGELVGLLREAKQEIVITVEESILSYAWWAVFVLGGCSFTIVWCGLVAAFYLAKGVPK